MIYDPKTKKYPYTEYTDEHYLVVKKNYGIKIDSDYNFVDTTKAYKRKRFFTGILLRLVVFPLTRINMGLKIKGKKNLKRHAKELENGAVSCSNHVHLWDYIAVMKAIAPVKPYVLSWQRNINGENGKLIRSVGGIPIPENDLKATITYMNAVGKLLDDGGWLHICSEGSMWEYYAPVRPFKKGAAFFACKHGKPILPLAFSYRKPGLLGKLIKSPASFTLTVGEPLFPDENLPFHARVEDLTIRSHRAVCELAGIAPEENIYPPLYNNTKRVDYY